MFAVFRLYFLAWMIVEVGPVSFSARQCWGDSQPRLLPNFPPPDPNAPLETLMNQSDWRTRACTQVKRGKSELLYLYSVLNWTWTKKAKGSEQVLAFGISWCVVITLAAYLPPPLSTPTHNPHPSILLYFPPPPYTPMPPPYLSPAYVPWLDFTR